MTNKQKYTEFTKQIYTPIYHQPWWLEILTDSWDVAIVTQNNKTIAALPYQIQKKYGFKLSLMPALTQRLGPLIDYSYASKKYFKILEFEKRIITELLSQLPKFHIFSQNLTLTFKNLLPFYWMGFNSKVRYTYLISSQPNIKDLPKKKRADLRKFSNLKAQITENPDIPAKLIHHFFTLPYITKKLKHNISEDKLTELEKYLKKKNQRLILTATLNSEIIGLIYIVFDQKYCYYLGGSYEPKFKNYSPTISLLWYAIEKCTKNNLIFDFEGSHQQSIEKIFRELGGIQTPFYNVYKFSNKLFCAFNCFKNLT